MTVAELIAQLKKLDPDCKVGFLSRPTYSDYLQPAVYVRTSPVREKEKGYYEPGYPDGEEVWVWLDFMKPPEANQ